MIRVTIEVDGYGHEYKFQREEEAFDVDVPATEMIDRLIGSVRASAHAALKAPADVID